MESTIKYRRGNYNPTILCFYVTIQSFFGDNN